MIIRMIHLIVVCLFVAAAVHVYKIKIDFTMQAERLARLRLEIKRERNAIAALRSEWAQLDTPVRIQQLAAASHQAEIGGRDAVRELRAPAGKTTADRADGRRRSDRGHHRKADSGGDPDIQTGSVPTEARREP